ncbi:hypothetical protein CSUI_005519, partial [Cystoisospora suis]
RKESKRVGRREERKTFFFSPLLIGSEYEKISPFHKETSCLLLFSIFFLFTFLSSHITHP